MELEVLTWQLRKSHISELVFFAWKMETIMNAPFKVSVRRFKRIHVFGKFTQTLHKEGVGGNKLMAF